MIQVKGLNLRSVTENSSESTTLNEEEKLIFKIYLNNSKKFHYHHIGVIDNLGLWTQRNNQSKKMVAVVSINRRAKQIVIGIHETPLTIYEKDKLRFLECCLHHINAKRLFITYKAFKNVAWRICEKVDEEKLDELIAECEREAE